MLERLQSVDRTLNMHKHKIQQRTKDNLVDYNLVIFFYFFLENRIWHFMQIVS